MWLHFFFDFKEDGASKTVDIAAESPSVSFNFYSYCKLHSDPDIVKQRQRTYNLLQKQVSTFKSAMTVRISPSDHLRVYMHRVVFPQVFVRIFATSKVVCSVDSTDVFFRMIMKFAPTFTD